MGYVGYVDPYPVAICGTLDRDRIVEIFCVGAVYGHRREVTEVPALPHLRLCDDLGLLIYLSRELAGGPENYVASLSAPAKLACDQHRTPLLDEERVCYRVLPPTNQHSRKYQESAPIRGIWQSTL